MEKESKHLEIRGKIQTEKRYFNCQVYWDLLSGPGPRLLVKQGVIQCDSILAVEQA